MNQTAEYARDRAQTSSEWRDNWTVVAAAMIGFSFLSVPPLTIGLFMGPLESAFGWGRSEIALGVSLGAIPGILLAPFVGMLVDRHGARKLAIPGLLLTGIAIAACSSVGGSIWNWYLIWCLYAVGSLGITQTIWTAPVTRRFVVSRGLALGLTVTGAATAQIIAPPLAQFLIEVRGWRDAFLWLGAGWGGLAFASVLLFFHDKVGHSNPVRAEGGTRNAENASPGPGLTLRQALGSRPLQLIAASSLLTMFFSYALVVHQVPILVESGTELRTAALLSSLTGAAGFVGKLATGWLMDRWRPAIVAGITLCLPAISFALLVAPFQTPTLIVVAMLIIGYAAGSKLQIAAQLTGVYGGLANYGAIFGMMSSLLALGAGMGPVAAGAVYDVSGNYQAFLLAGIVSSLVSGLLLFGLGPCPEIPAPTKPDIAVNPGGGS